MARMEEEPREQQQFPLELVKMNGSFFESCIREYMSYKDGIYIEAGANDGVKLSNTLFLEQEFNWRLPLDSAFPDSVCPKCGETCKGSWNYCPWCKKKLNKNK